MEKSTEPRGNLISFLHSHYPITKYPLSSHCFACRFVVTFLLSGVCSVVDAGQLSRVTEEEDENSKQESSTLHRNKDNTCAVVVV